jgi:serine/threonine protein phosphatase PrpC
MMIAQTAGLTDAGRKRRRNEDAYVVEPPLFVVADGMGGAQAGEVASRLAAAAFRDFHDADELDAEERVVAIIQEANRRIYERARADRDASGMGTTVTAALVAGDRIAVGHVGDSRAYRIRAGRLEQLTDDHSLVADLVRSGRLTPEEADTHPQRSVITRALGTDPEVDVDSLSVAAEAGDLILLCSDGLTTMVADEEILDLVARAKSLDAAVKSLVKAANRAGGEDNVTAVLFQLEADRHEAIEETAVMSGDGRGADPDLEDTLTGLELSTAGAPAATLEREDVGWPSAEDELEAELDEDVVPARPTARRRRSWPRRLLLVVLALAFVAIVAAVALWALSRANFIGADEDGNLAVYQGLPYDLGGGVSLYRVRYVSRLQAVQLTAPEREALLGHDLVSYEQARARLARYEQEGVP